jgi:Ca-activated chloride channel family protein
MRNTLALFLLSLCACAEYQVYEDDGGMSDLSQTPPPSEPEEPEEQADTATDACEGAEPISLYISPDDSNSMVSPVMAREAVLDGWSGLDRVAIRPWEFLNYYDFTLQPPEEEDLAIHISAVPDPKGDDSDWIMQIGLVSKPQARADRDPLNLTFSLDTSGSMGGDPIAMAKASCRVIAGQLREGDIVSVVTWSSGQAIELANHRVSGPDDPVLMALIDRLDSNGGTDLNAGLVAAYGLAEANYAPDRINRVILISDGGANLGQTDETIIAEAAAHEDMEGIYLAGIGVGEAGTYNATLMDTVTDLGRGAALFIDDEEEAQRMLGAGFLEVMEVAARNVQVRMDLPAGVRMTAFSGEEFSTDQDEIEPQHLAPNDTMIFQEHLAACDAEILEDAEITVAVEWQDATSFERRSAELTLPWSELSEGRLDQLWKGEAIYLYALALQKFRSHGGQSDAFLKAKSRWWQAQLMAESLNAHDRDLSEIRSVMHAL